MDQIDSSKFDELKPLHKKHIEMLSDLDAFCTKYDISWCLAYGSVLGARRHGESIPWDDDVDIYMTASEYDKFRRVFKEYGNHNKYYLQEVIRSDNMVEVPKLRLNNSTFIQDGMQHLDMHHGIFIDIFILHNAPSSKLDRFLGKWLGVYVEVKRMSNQKYKKRKLFIPLMRFLGLFPKSFGIKTALKFNYRFDSKDSDEFVVWGVCNNFFNRSVIYPTRKLNYGGILVNVPNQVDNYLEMIYGDWQKIPNLSEIQWTQHACYWSTTEDFRNYAKNIKNFSDEQGSQYINEKEGRM